MRSTQSDQCWARQALVGIVLAVVLTACDGASSPSANQGVSVGPAPTTTVAASAPSEVPPADIKAAGLLGGDASPDVPAGDPAKVSVVVVGPVPTDQSVLYSIPIIVRNNTDKAVGRVQVTAAARDAAGNRVSGLDRDADGHLANLGNSQGFQPVSMQPGEAALGAVYFRAKSTVPVDATFEFTVEASPPGADPAYASTSLKVTEANLVGGKVGGTATNSTGKPVKGPFAAQVFCFDGSGQLAATAVDFAAPDNVDVDGTAPFQVDVSKLACTTFLVGVSSIFQIPPVTRPS